MIGKIKAMVEKDAAEIVKAIIDRAKTGDVEACRIFCRYLSASKDGHRAL